MLTEPVFFFDRTPAQYASLIFMTLLLWLFAGCSTVPREVKAGRQSVQQPQVGQARETKAPSQFGWWSVRFRNVRAEDESPRWHVDLMLADLVVEPVIEQFAGDLALWRFHRRAGRDDPGHQFSFVFYSDPETARKVFVAIEGTPILQRMQENSVVDMVRYDDYTVIARPDISDTSDESWLPALQRVWPAYIMGASVMWLGLINEHVVISDPLAVEFEELEDYYETANTQITSLWRNEGQHPFLHHLNALFGYSPMLLQSETKF